MKTCSLVFAVLLAFISNAYAYLDAFGYKVTVVIGPNQSRYPSPHGVIYISFAGDNFTEEHKLIRTTKQLIPGIRDFYVESRHRIEDISHLIFEWSWSLSTNPYLSIEKIIVEPTYLFPGSKNVESQKIFSGLGNVTQVGTDEKVRLDNTKESTTKDKNGDQKDDKKVVIEQSAMPKDMQEHAISTALRAIDTYKATHEAATFIGNEFNKKYGKYWQCVLGNHFTSRIFHNPNHYIRFSIGDLKILLFRTD